MTGLEDFRCAAALRSRLGVRLALAGAAARGEVRGFPGASAGMVSPAAERGSGSHRLQARGRFPLFKAAPPRLCEPRAAFFPTLAPANERPPRPPTRPAGRPRPLSVTRPLPARRPAGDKGELGPVPRPPPAPRGPGGKPPCCPLRAAPQQEAPWAPGCGPGRSREAHLPPSGTSEREILQGNRVRGAGEPRPADPSFPAVRVPPGLEPPHSRASPCRVSAPGTPPPAAPTKDP